MLVEIILLFGKIKKKIYQWKKVMRIARVRSRRRIRRDSLIFKMIGNEVVVIVLVVV